MTLDHHRVTAHRVKQVLAQKTSGLISYETAQDEFWPNQLQMLLCKGVQRPPKTGTNQNHTKLTLVVGDLGVLRCNWVG